MASSSSSSSGSYVYDVFLSFRGEDTRKTFVDHLYSALEQRQIRTYKDDVTLPRGESVGPALLKAIEESRHAVIIFSKNYANSSWCLDELVHIMKCRAENGLIVMPIFYDVDPSDVRKHKRDFGEAFSKQVGENTTKAELWRKKLIAASNISGWEPKNIANGHEATVIKKIVDTIFDELFPLNSDIDEGLVGMRARLQDLISQLEIGSGGVRMVGIWGLGGGGKTTLATSVYMEIMCHFKSHCIIENIREELNVHTELRWLHLEYDSCTELNVHTELRWLHLSMTHAEIVETSNCLFPDSFQAKNLVFFSLHGSNQKLLWKGYKHLPQLKVLHLVWFERLVSTPDFNGLPRLQKLELTHCYELEEIHPSLGNHRSLKDVHVFGCSKLRMFPTIVRMEQLESLHISSCHKSLVFPEIQANMECLVKLHVSGIQIDALLSSIGECCTNLIYLSLVECFTLNSTEVKFYGLKCLEEFICSYPNGPLENPSPLLLTHSLIKLDLSSCWFEDGEIPSDIGELSNLEELNLSYNNFSKLHFSLSQLTRLKLLNLSDCKRLVKLPELPSSIANIIADGCEKLTSIGNLSENCKWLSYISLNEGTGIDGNRLLQSMFKGNAVENQSMHLKIRGLEIPKQFTNRLYAGDRCRLPLPGNWCNDFGGFLICAALDYYGSFFPNYITVKEDVSDDMRGMFIDDEVWGESFGGNLTWAWYVSFASLEPNAQECFVSHSQPWV